MKRRWGGRGNQTAASPVEKAANKENSGDDRSRHNDVKISILTLAAGNSSAISYGSSSSQCPFSNDFHT